jgi:hypothetical protein
MRSRLILKLISLIVVVILGIMAFRTFSGSSSASSPINPVNVARNGLAGVCADQEAVAAAGGSDDTGDSPPTAISPTEESQLQASDPSGLSALESEAGSLSCPTSDTAP